MTSPVLNRYSSRITQPRSQGASQAMLLGTGLQSADLDKPQVGIAAMWLWLSAVHSATWHMGTLRQKSSGNFADIVTANTHLRTTKSAT